MGAGSPVIASLQYHPVKNAGTALNIITEASNKMALTQLQSAKKILIAGQDLIANKDKELAILDKISSKVSEFY